MFMVETIIKFNRTQYGSRAKNGQDTKRAARVKSAI